MSARQYSSIVEAKTLSLGINSSITTMTLSNTTSLPNTYPYTLVIDPDVATEEIVTVTAAAGGNALTITRGQDGTTAQAHSGSAVVKHMITARDLQEPQNHIYSNTSVHGVTGSVVGTSDIQTLTNKTLTNPTITGAVVTSANIVDATIAGSDIASGTITSANIADGTIVNADISAGANIAASKLSGVVTPTSTDYLTNKTLEEPITVFGSNVRLGDALASRTTGSSNVGIGNDVLSLLTGAQQNVAVGISALAANTADRNTAVGFVAGGSNTTGAFNTYIGYQTGNTATSYTGGNNTIIGNGANPTTGSVSNQIVLGNSSITDLRCQDTTITAVSDARDKTDVQDIPVGLDFINEIRPVNFEWNMRDGGQVGNRQGGFIAQEVLAVEEKYDTRDWLKMVNTENPEQLALAPAKLIPVMVKALQELSEQVEELKAKVAELEAK